jgi:outer membrane lipoprotein SlyB
VGAAVGGVSGVAVADWTGAVVSAVVGAAGVLVAAGLPQAVLNISAAINTIIKVDFDLCVMRVSSLKWFSVL